MSNLRTGGQILVDQLKIHGAELAFCVPGESYLAVLDALHDAQANEVTALPDAANTSRLSNQPRTAYE